MKINFNKDKYSDIKSKYGSLEPCSSSNNFGSEILISGCRGIYFLFCPTSVFPWLSLDHNTS